MKVCERCGQPFESAMQTPGAECWCAKCLAEFTLPTADRGASELLEGEDFYYDHGLFVFTSAYHLKRGECCGSGCRHCPWGKGN